MRIVGQPVRQRLDHPFEILDPARLRRDERRPAREPARELLDPVEFGCDVLEPGGGIAQGVDQRLPRAFGQLRGLGVQFAREIDQ